MDVWEWGWFWGWGSGVASSPSAQEGLRRVFGRGTRLLVLVLTFALTACGGSVKRSGPPAGAEPAGGEPSQGGGEAGLLQAREARRDSHAREFRITESDPAKPGFPDPKKVLFDSDRDALRMGGMIEFRPVASAEGAFLVWPAESDGHRTVEAVYTPGEQDVLNRESQVAQREMALRTSDGQWWFIPLAKLVPGGAIAATPRRRYFVRIELHEEDGALSELVVGLRLRGPLPELKSEFDGGLQGGWFPEVRTSGVSMGREVFRNPSRTRTLVVEISVGGSVELLTGVRVFVPNILGNMPRLSNYYRKAVARGRVRSSLTRFELKPGEARTVSYLGDVAEAPFCRWQDQVVVGGLPEQAIVKGRLLTGSFHREVRWSDPDLEGQGPQGRLSTQGAELYEPWGEDAREMFPLPCQGFYST